MYVDQWAVSGFEIFPAQNAFLWIDEISVRVAFAMSINKSQGQTLDKCGVILKSPVFAHGQLYVETSRVGHPDNLQVF